MPPHRLFSRAAAVIGCAIVVAGCSSSSTQTHPSAGPTSPSVTSSPPATTFPGCRLPKRIPYPAWVPTALPLPRGIYASRRLPTESGYFRGLFVIPGTTTQFARLVLSQWPKAGWSLGRGDAEAGEVEDQFIKGLSFGAFKVQDMYCTPAHSIMLLIYAPDRSKLPGISTQGGTPLPGHPSPSPSPSPTAS